MSDPRDFGSLPLRHLQATQPWTVPYNNRFEHEVLLDLGLGHLMGSHITLHAAKTVGQIAAVFEAADHTGARLEGNPSAVQVLSDKAADLVTAAMRLANLYGFDLARAVVQRSEEKNNVTLPPWAPCLDAEGETRL